MAVRIYALAKELKLDSKVLVDICTRAGVSGKGSALASLTDEELATVNAFMAKMKGGRSDAAKPARPGESAPVEQPLRRDDYVGHAGGKVPVLPTRPPERLSPSRRKPEEPERSTPLAATQPPTATPSAPVDSSPPSVAAATTTEPTREDAGPATAPLGSQPTDVTPAYHPPADVKTQAPAKPVSSPLGSRVSETVHPGATSAAAADAAVPSHSTPAAPKASPPPGAPPVSHGPPPIPLGPVRPAARASGPSLPPLERRVRRDHDRPKEPPRERTGPAIKLAPLPPSARTPRPTKKPDEPAPQKPDIKLPLDAIRASRAGGKPLSEHIRKHEEKRRKDEAQAGKSPRAPAAGAPAEVSALLDLPGALRDKTKRPKKPGGEEGEGAPLPLGGREQRQLKRKRPTGSRGRRDDDDDSPRRASHIRRTGANTAAPRKGRIVVNLPCSVRDFCEASGVSARIVLSKMLELGVMSNIAANLDPDLAELLAAELGLEIDFHKPEDLESRVASQFEEQEDAPELLQPRPPVITFLGHVDHGKTSLLDRILGLNVVAGEKGGITQHIRAYQIEKDGRKISFVDTPGHEAFTEMRARGANVTDIAVLVVAADDGVMPQTEEAISHAKAAEVPIVVALNKIDLPSANPDRAYQQLAAAGLLPTEWGGDTEVVKTSATTGAGMDELLETLLTVAELHEYKANPDRPAVGTCLEASLHEGRGVIAKVLVQKGTLRVGDIVVCGPAYGRVKAMLDTLNERKRFEAAGPSTPVHLTGLNVAPGAGDRFYVLEDIAEARNLAEGRAVQARQRELTGTVTHVTLENLYDRLGKADSVQTLNIILRADVRGSIEAIQKELTKLEHPEVQIKVLQATVGGVTEADVHLADASDAIIVGFSVVPDEAARALADRRGVQIRRYDIIYKLTEDLKLALEGMLRPEKREKEMGRALVQRTFHISRVGTVAGCRVLSGTITRDSRIRVIRESRIIGEYALDSLKREKDDAREVREGLECGMKLAGFNDLKEGDLFEAYKIEEVARTL